MFASISINNRCNLRCKMCDIGQRNKESSGMAANWDSKKELKAEEWLVIFNRHNIKKIHVTGTEPLLYRDLPKFLELCSPGRHIYLTTNGFMATQENVELLARYCNELAISIDGSTPAVHDKIRGVEGSFDKALCMAKDLRDLNKRIKISYAISPDNIHDIKDAYDLFVKLGKMKMIFNHYNYIHPISAEGHCKPTNMEVYDPKDVNLKVLLEAVQYCKHAKFSPNLRTKKELKQYYRKVPTKIIQHGAGCVVFNGTVRGERCAINAAGDFIPSSRCWVNLDLGNALTDPLPRENKALRNITRNIAEQGFPPPCQRLCCAGKVL